MKGSRGGWCSAFADETEFLEVNLGNKTAVSGKVFRKLVYLSLDFMGLNYFISISILFHRVAFSLLVSFFVGQSEEYTRMKVP